MNDGAVSSGRSATTYRIGDLVALRSDPGTVAPVIEVTSDGAAIAPLGCRSISRMPSLFLSSGQLR